MIAARHRGQDLRRHLEPDDLSSNRHPSLSFSRDHALLAAIVNGCRCVAARRPVDGGDGCAALVNGIGEPGNEKAPAGEPSEAGAQAGMSSMRPTSLVGIGSVGWRGLNALGREWFQVWGGC